MSKINKLTATAALTLSIASQPVNAHPTPTEVSTNITEISRKLHGETTNVDGEPITTIPTATGQTVTIEGLGECYVATNAANEPATIGVRCTDLANEKFTFVDTYANGNMTCDEIPFNEFQPHNRMDSSSEVCADVIARVNEAIR